MSKNTFFRVSNESPQAVAANDRRARQGATYHDFAAAEQGTVQGRFAAQERSMVTGASSAPSYPQQPASSPWASEPVGLEPPLGEDLSAAPIVGEPHEVAASLAESQGSEGIDPPASPPSGPPNDEGRAPRGGNLPADASRRPRRLSRHKKG